MSGITKLMTAGGGGVALTPASSIASDVTVQIPSVDCTLLSNKTAGTVLQVVSYSTSTQTSTSSTSFVSTPITVNITPTNATSKILVQVTGTHYGNGVSTAYRNSTNLGNATYGFTEWSSTTAIDNPMSLSILDSPATTSSTAYTLYIRAVTGTYFVNINTTTTTITLMEIAA